MVVRCVWVPTEAQRGHQIPCSWSTRRNGYWDPALGLLGKQTEITTPLGVLFLPQGLPFSTLYTASPFKIVFVLGFPLYLGLCATCVSGAQEDQEDRVTQTSSR